MYSTHAPEKRHCSSYHSFICFICVGIKAVFGMPLCCASLIAFAEEPIVCSDCTTGKAALYGKSYLCDQCLYTILKEKVENADSETELSFIMQQASSAVANAGDTLFTTGKKALPGSFADFKSSAQNFCQNYKLKTAGYVTGACFTFFAPGGAIFLGTGYLIAKGLENREKYQKRLASKPKGPVHLTAKPIIQSIEAKLANYCSLDMQSDLLFQLLKHVLEQYINTNRVAAALALSMQWSQHPQQTLDDSIMNSDIVTGLRGITTFPDSSHHLQRLMHTEGVPFKLHDMSTDHSNLVSDINMADSTQTFKEMLSSFINHSLNIGETFCLGINPVGVISFHRNKDGRFYIYNSVSDSQFSIADNSGGESRLSLDFYLTQCVSTIASVAGDTPLTLKLFHSLDHSK